MFKKAIIVALAGLMMPVWGFAEDVDLGQIVVTPSGYEQKAINYPGNVTVITEKEIEESNAKFVYELLRDEAGIYVFDYTHVGKAVTVDMRGFGEYASRNVLVLIDGRRVNEIDISGTDWSQVPLENVERIEISRGSGSVLYGDNASAGVINIITKKGKAGHKIKAGVDFGSYRYQNYYTGVSGSEDFASYNFFAKREKTDGYRLNGDYDGYDVMGNMTIYPADYLSVDFEGGYHKDWYGMPSGLQRWEIDRIGRRGSTTPNDRVKTETTFLRIKPDVHFSTGNMDHNFIVDFWGRKRRFSMTTWDNFFGWYASWDDSQIDSKGGSLKYVNTYENDTVKNTLTLGCDLLAAENRLLTVTPQWATYNQLKIKKQTLGIYINDQIELWEKVIASGGVRQEWVYYVFDQSENAGRYETSTPDQEAFDIGIEYKYLPEGGVYGRFARSFRFPATDEFYSRWTGLNSSLKHQVDDTWEVGVKDRSWKCFQPSVNFFWMNTKDEIFYDPTVGGFGDNRNYDHTRRFGIEAGASSDLVDNVNIYCNYTYLKARYDGGKFAGNRIPMVPEHKVVFGVNWYPVECLDINFNSLYVSDQYSINDDANNLAALKPYFVCNGKITAKYKGWKIFFGINNIFDAVYSEIASSNTAGTVTDYFPAPDRNYMFGASAEF